MRKLQNDELDRLSLEEFKQVKKIPLWVVLDNVRSLITLARCFGPPMHFCWKVSCFVELQPHLPIEKFTKPPWEPLIRLDGNTEGNC